MVLRKAAEDEVHRINIGLEHIVDKRTKDLQEAKKQAEVLARTDVLTGMNNRRSFFELAKNIAEQSGRYGHPYTIMALDLDFFKRVNDTHGHHVGDIALKATAIAITKVIRTSDVAGRLGGEEFSIILPETSVNKAEDLAERLRQAIADIVIPLGKESLNFTASIGITENNKDDTSIEDVMRRADDALYQAKEQGRNRVILFEQ